ncbi:hypothetical protein CUMW_038420 [Citrus unshiu]|nr:hypothetical protein CUMW_038420 [Citrus unshiu]
MFHQVDEDAALKLLPYYVDLRFYASIMAELMFGVRTLFCHLLSGCPPFGQISSRTYGLTFRKCQGIEKKMLDRIQREGLLLRSPLLSLFNLLTLKQASRF